MTSLLLAVWMVLAGPVVADPVLADTPDVKVKFSPKVGEVASTVQGEPLLAPPLQVPPSQVGQG